MKGGQKEKEREREDERGTRNGRMLRHLCKCSMFYRVFFAIAYFEYPIPDHHFLSDLISIPLPGRLCGAGGSLGTPNIFSSSFFYMCVSVYFVPMTQH